MLGWGSPAAAASTIDDIRPADALRLECGRTVTGTVEAGKQERFTFNAWPGEVVAIDAVDTAGQRAMTQLQLVGPGLRVNTCTGRIDPSSQLIRPRRLQGGSYLLGITECFERDLEYALTLNVVSDSPRNCGAPLRCGERTRGELTVPGSVQAFRVRADRGDVVHLAVEETSVRGGLELRIFGPDGQPLGDEPAGCVSQQRIVVEKSGQQTILVNSCWGKHTGPYRLAWLESSCPGAIDLTPTPTPPRFEQTPTAPNPCPGDCDGDGHVTVNEIVQLLVPALRGTVDSCPAGDVNGDGRITVDEIITAIDVALNGCSLDAGS